ncbi:hypothetical protein B0H16DRAFT_1473483 [Mycena metata]|uniref:Uncharacterized protein n=1 Tax=Mycena metata TaxID=1033252 RepID=A0AAD7HKY5_9AGAR|nr:hypothetical protein B0H16DRAFT_1473483 [Mycena metata]
MTEKKRAQHSKQDPGFPRLHTLDFLRQVGIGIILYFVIGGGTVDLGQSFGQLTRPGNRFPANGTGSGMGKGTRSGTGKGTQSGMGGAFVRGAMGTAGRHLLLKRLALRVERPGSLDLLAGVPSGGQHNLVLLAGLR